MEFLRAIPTVWDETRVLDGRIGDYVVVARRRGQDWFVGAMTDWTPRELEIDLASFLPAGSDKPDKPTTWQIISFADGPDADRTATSYRRESAALSARPRLKVKLAPGVVGRRESAPPPARRQQSHEHEGDARRIRAGAADLTPAAARRAAGVRRSVGAGGPG